MSFFPPKISACFSIVMSAFVAGTAMAQTAPAPQPAKPAAPPAAAPAPAASAPVAPAPAASAPVAPAAAAPAAVVHEHDLYPGLQVAITSIKRTPENTLTLRWDMINTTDEPITMEDVRNNYQDMPDYFYDKVNLLDLTNRKKYSALKDGDGRHVGRAIRLQPDPGSSRGDHLVFPPKSKTSLWLKFPALSKEIQSIGVEINGVEPFGQMPITD